MRKNHRKNRSVLPFLTIFCAICLLAGCSGAEDSGSDAPSTPSDTATTTVTESKQPGGTETAATDGGTTVSSTTQTASVAGATQGKTTAATGVTTMAGEQPAEDGAGLTGVRFAECAGDIVVDKAAKTVTIPVKGDKDLAGKLPVLQTAAGYTAKLVRGKDLNSSLVYTVSNGKVSERWTVTTAEDYAGIPKATSLSVATLFKNGAVLQRDAEVRIFGRCKGAAVVTVEFGGQKKRCAVADGRWEVTLDPMPANSIEQTLVVTTAGKTVDSENILVGDVWFCSGQSNMYWFATSDKEIASLADLKTVKSIRCFSIPELWNTEPKEDFSSSAAWRYASQYVERKISMYALSFAARLQQEEKVPVGIVVAATGGTLIEHWLPDDSLVAAGTSRDTPQTGYGARQGVGTGMYNSMVCPLEGLTVKGILWYQGEANVNATSDYVRLFAEYAKCYRRLFRDEDLPIIATQLPKFHMNEYAKWPEFRLTQREATDGVRNAYLVCGIDLGEAGNIHPADKRAYGTRAAELALNTVYGKATPGESAYPTAVKGSGTTVTIRFKNAESGLKLISGSAVRELYGVTASGQAIAPTSVKLQGDTLVLTMSEAVVRIDYAMKTVPGVNLYTGNGLPVAPFSLPVN